MIMKRGRPRKVDPEKALEAARNIFWQKGYDGTSMADLVQATGMAKPGLYSTFGDKETLYAKALDKYFSEGSMTLINELLNSKLPPKEAVRVFLTTIADGMFDETTPSGCFLTNCVVECESEIPKLEKIGRKYNEMRRRAFITYFQKAKADGKLSVNADTEALAEFYSGQALTLAVLDKAGTDRESMNRFIDTAMSVLENLNKY